MNLVAYSDSEGSGDEAPPSFNTHTTKEATTKPAFQKVVDRSNPGKIKLNLPGVSQQTEKDDIEAEAPPAKKARVGGGAFSGFNAMLPAPKKPKANVASEGAGLGKRGLGRGLGAGVSLKTGAEPAFKRESRAEEGDYDENGDPVQREPLKKDDFRAMLNLPPPKSKENVEEEPVPHTDAVKQDTNENKPTQPPRFMPMSVNRGKKKKPVPKSFAGTVEERKIVLPSTSASVPPTIEPKPTPKPKVSLFSISQETTGPTKDQSSGAYQPLLYGAEEEEEAPMPDEAFDEEIAFQQHASSHTKPTAAADSHLTNIASELNLSEAEKRQLFGRKGHGPDFSSAKIMEFNTDSEYAHNEMLRQQGETVQHNALKSITGTGKNSLRSLVNVATTQKDALEDHFAQGRRNKREAGNKYGW